jgi:hypothetical protein
MSMRQIEMRCGNAAKLTFDAGLIADIDLGHCHDHTGSRLNCHVEWLGGLGEGSCW